MAIFTLKRKKNMPRNINNIRLISTLIYTIVFSISVFKNTLIAFIFQLNQ